MAILNYSAEQINNLLAKVQNGTASESEIASLREQLTNIRAGASEEYDTFKEIEDAIKSLQDNGTQGPAGKSAYELYCDTVTEGEPMLLQDWLNSLKGTDGQDGKDGKDGQDGKDGTFDDSELQNYVTKDELSNCSYLTEHQDISGKANVGDSYTKAESDAKYLTEHQDLSSYATKDELNNLHIPTTLGELQNDCGYVSHQVVEDYIKVETAYIISYIVGEAPETLNTLKEIADVLTDESSTLGELTEAITTKANVGDSYTKAESDAKYLTEHQNLSSYVTKDELSNCGYLTEHQDISGKANVGDSYTKAESDAKYLTEHQDLSSYVTKTELSEYGYLTEHQDLSSYVTKDELNEYGYLTEHQDLSDYISRDELNECGYLTEHQSLADYADGLEYDNETRKISLKHGENVLCEINANDFVKDGMVDTAYVQGSNLVISFNTDADKQSIEIPLANIFDPTNYYTTTDADGRFQLKGDYATKAEIANAGYLTQTLLENYNYATEEYVADVVNVAVDEIIGGAPENFDTLKEFADAFSDLKVVDVEAVPAVEGVKYTQEEIDNAQEGDAAYGKTTDDWAVEPVEAVEEVSHNMTITEYVNTSMQAVNEKEDVAKIKTKYEALLSLINIRESQVNSVVLNNQLEEAQNSTASSPVVEFNEPVETIVIPETNKAFTVAAPLDNNSTVTLTSNKYMTLDNTSEEAVSATVQRPAAEGETGTSGTTVYLVGQYDTLTLENVSPNVKSGRDAAVVNNVVITENNTKNLTLNLDLQDGATITNNSATSITINDKNNEETVLAVVAPNSTVTLNGGTYTTLNASVSDNTLIIKKNAHIGTLNVTRGNVTVEVARESDIASVIDNYTIADGFSIDYLHDEITSANISKLTTTGTHVLTENINKNARFAPSMFENYDIVWDLNNHNITFTNTQGYANYLVRGTTHLEIKGNGIVRNDANDYGFWTNSAGAKIVINGGTYYGATSVLYSTGGTIEVNGGEFHLTDPDTAEKDQNGNFKFLLNCHDPEYLDETAKIIVRGGIFYGFNPGESYGEPNGPVSLVASGYESIEITDQVNDANGLKVYKVVEK